MLTGATPKAGFMPLYLKLYDDLLPRVRHGFVPFLKAAVEELRARGIGVVEAEICRTAAECRRALKTFEGQAADAVVTLHLAYSPSLEAVGALARLRLPVIMLDTTMDPSFGPDTEADRVMFNHGVHGVMDLANRLRRAGVPYVIVSGAFRDSAVMDRAAAAVRAASAARRLRNARTLRIGAPFRGMGDVALSPVALRRWLGQAPATVHPSDVARRALEIPSARVDSEMAQDRDRYTCDLPPEVHERSVRVGLALRERITAGHYDAFSFNFLDWARTGEEGGGVPFLEASKAMARGLGYAGEGDVLTAALVGALGRSFGATTFTEIFCPDWRGQSLFLSHLGEVNPDVLSGRPKLVEMRSAFTGAVPTATILGGLRPGAATYVNLSPGPDDELSLIVAPVEVLEDRTRGTLARRIRGWIRPRLPVPEFLEAYSRAGGTHHAALVLLECAEAMEALATFAGLAFVRIG